MVPYLSFLPRGTFKMESLRPHQPALLDTHSLVPPGSSFMHISDTSRGDWGLDLGSASAAFKINTVIADNELPAEMPFKVLEA